VKRLLSIIFLAGQETVTFVLIDEFGTVINSNAAQQAAIDPMNKSIYLSISIKTNF